MTKLLHFWKLESIGNDFPLIYEKDKPDGMSVEDLAIKLCDRRFGIGGDGLLTVEKVSERSLRLRMFNPDGTEDFCGNGIRCAAHFARIQNLFGDEFDILHLDRTVKVEIDGRTIRTEIGTASYEPKDVPLAEGLSELFQAPVYIGKETIKGSALTTGSTHVIVPVDELPSDTELETLGPRIEHFPFYPQRTSVIWRQVLTPQNIKIRIWERGVGETFGCGTGSSAAVADLFRSQNRGGKVSVSNPGGTVKVCAEAWDQPIWVEGVAKIVYEGDFAL